VGALTRAGEQKLEAHAEEYPLETRSLYLQKLGCDCKGGDQKAEDEGATGEWPVLMTTSRSHDALHEEGTSHDTQDE
jgi:hypothetical protein